MATQLRVDPLGGTFDGNRQQVFIEDVPTRFFHEEFLMIGDPLLHVCRRSLKKGPAELRSRQGHRSHTCDTRI